MSSLEIHQISTRQDNYVSLIRDTETGTAGVVDPSGGVPELMGDERKANPFPRPMRPGWPAGTRSPYFSEVRTRIANF